MANENYQGFTGYGLDTDERNNIRFCGRSTYAKRNMETAFCAAQLSIVFYEWLGSQPSGATVADLMDQLDNTSI